MVTGGGSGIGAATCTRLAAEGATVLVTDMDPDAAAATAARIADEGQSAAAAGLDVAGSDLDERIPALIEEHLGELDALINNAGVGRPGSVLETSEDDWRLMFAVNVDGVFHCTRAVLPAMLERGRGTIVNVASIAGITGLTNRFGYCATKGAVVSMTRALALDYAGTGVRVNCVCPGTIETPWVESMAERAPDREQFFGEMRARQPVGRLGTADEIAAAIAFLCSADAEFMTGSAMVIDGGLTAGIPRKR